MIVPQSGGSQGSKGYLYADAPLLLHLSKVLGRPVKWIDTRAGLARSTVQGRDQIQDVTLAGTRDGKIQALTCTAYSNVGAYPVINAPGSPTVLIGRSITGQYAIDHPFYEVNVVYTNTVPVGPLRGSGRAEATFLTERIVDLYAAEIGMDPAEVRRRNQVQPSAFPYENHLGWTYDSGDYPTALEKALAKVDYPNLTDRKAEARKRGKRLGVGIGSYVAVAGVGPSAQMGAAGLVSGTWGSAIVRVQPSGEVTITTGAQPHGQSQETTFAQIAAEGLGIPVAMISVTHSDTSGTLYFGQASYGSRSLSVEGTAVHLAVEKIKDKAIKLVSHLFKAPPEALVFENGGVHVVGNAAQGMTPATDRVRTLARLGSAGGDGAGPRGLRLLRSAELQLPIRDPRRDRRGRRGHRARRPRAIRGRRRLRRRRQSGGGRRPDPRQHRARRRPGAARAGRRTTRTAAS